MNDFNINYAICNEASTGNEKGLYIIESVTDNGTNFIHNMNNDIDWQLLDSTNEENIIITEDKKTINSFIEYLNINNIKYTWGSK